MRKIKFRVFDTTTHDMYFPGEDGSQLVVGMTHALDGDKNYLALWADAGEICREGQAEFMQYTGRKDKNGREIYEGDIILYEDAGSVQTSCGTEYDTFNNEGVIEWSEEEARYTVTNRESIDNDGFWDYIEDSEVIGNIYENPELLEATE